MTMFTYIKFLSEYKEEYHFLGSIPGEATSFNTHNLNVTNIFNSKKIFGCSFGYSFYFQSGSIDGIFLGRDICDPINKRCI